MKPLQRQPSGLELNSMQVHPITPSSEIMEYLSLASPGSRRQFRTGGKRAGRHQHGNRRSRVRSQGPDRFLRPRHIPETGRRIHLSDEGLSAVVITQVRYGNGLGTCWSAQCDYNRETRAAATAITAVWYLPLLRSRNSWTDAPGL